MTFTNSQWQEAEVALANAGGSGGGPVTAVSGAFVAGAIADGGSTTLGAKADAKSSATDTTPITAMQVLKQISYMLQNPAALSAGSALLGGIEVYDGGGTNKLAVDASGRLTLVPNQVMEIGDGTMPSQKLAIDASGRITLVPNQTFELVDSGGTNKLSIDSSGRITLVPNQVMEIGDGTTPSQKLAIDSSGRLTLVPNSTVNLNEVAGNAIAPGSNAVPILNSAATGYVSAYGSNPTALTSNTDAAFKWGISGTTQVNHIMIQNNSTNNIQWDLDVATNAGSPILGNVAPGNTLFLDVQTTALHLQSIGTPNLNGSSGGNIVIRAWL